MDVHSDLEGLEGLQINSRKEGGSKATTYQVSALMDP